MSLFGDLHPPADPPTRDHPECMVFAWIGQAIMSCDQCGKPLWEHLYHPPYGGGPTLFRVKQRKRYGDRIWYWARVGSLVNRSEHAPPRPPAPAPLPSPAHPGTASA
jgi:hypothetical protein